MSAPVPQSGRVRGNRAAGNSLRDLLGRGGFLAQGCTDLFESTN
jgi:hypothetical protein